MYLRRLIGNVPIGRFLRAQEGATAIEYALIASGVSIAVVATVMSVGSALRMNFYDKLAALL